MKPVIIIFILATFYSAAATGFTTFGKSSRHSSTTRDQIMGLRRLGKAPGYSPTMRDQIRAGVKGILNEAKDNQTIITQVAEKIQQIRSESLKNKIKILERAISNSTSSIEVLARVPIIEELHQTLENVKHGPAVLQILNTTLRDAATEWLLEKSDSAEQKVIDIVLNAIIEDLKALINQTQKQSERLQQQRDKFIDDVKKIMSVSGNDDLILRMSSVTQLAQKQQEVEPQILGLKLVLKMGKRVLAELEGKTDCGEMCDDIIIGTCHNYSI